MKRKIKAIGSVPATKHMFMHEDKNTSVADYWERTHNIRLQHPEAPCVQVSATACKSLLCRFDVPDSPCVPCRVPVSLAPSSRQVLRKSVDQDGSVHR
jgi:hypothetical protein